MTKYWGPLGWMTLHSISLNYPDTPSVEDKQILLRFMDNFTESITCQYCQSHFKTIFQTYKGLFPSWNSSKYDLFVFIARAHNTVNKRLDKPLIRTVAQCLETIKSNTKNTSLSGFRQAYINYLISNWSRELSGEGRLKIGHSKQLQKINNEYWSFREVDIDSLNFPETDVLFDIEQRSVLPKATGGLPSIYKGSLPNVGFRFSGGKLKLGNM
jgi:hypothetical protein